MNLLQSLISHVWATITVPHQGEDTGEPTTLTAKPLTTPAPQPSSWTGKCQHLHSHSVYQSLNRFSFKVSNKKTKYHMEMHLNLLFIRQHPRGTTTTSYNALSSAQLEWKPSYDFCCRKYKKTEGSFRSILFEWLRVWSPKIDKKKLVVRESYLEQSLSTPGPLCMK